MQPTTDYLTTVEVAAHLRLKERTIYELVARRAIPCSRVTGKLLFPRRLVDRWVDGNLAFDGPDLERPPPILAGSSDPLLDWALRESGSGLAMLAEGSEAGLRRLGEGAAVAAGLHLPPDEICDAPAERERASSGNAASGNVGGLRRLSGLHDAVLLEWAVREQGLVVARGNPLGLAGIADLASRRPRLIVRQEGAGGRLLLDRLLAGAGMAAGDLDRAPGVALTDDDVALAVLDGSADCGLAIGAVARRFGLGFAPVCRERFDIACRRRDAFEPPLQALLAFARTDAFRARAAQLGHYDVSNTGRVRFNA